MNFFPVLTFLIFLLIFSLNVLTRCLHFYHDSWCERKKINSSIIFQGFYLKVEEKVLEIHWHYWLSITWILNKSNSIQAPLRYFRNQTTLTAPFCANFTFDNSNSPCLEHFLFDPNSRLISLQILSLQVLNLVAPIFSIAIHIKFYFLSLGLQYWFYFEIYSQSRISTQNNQ